MFFLTFSILPLSLAAQEETGVALFNLQGQGISELETETLTQYMRSELQETGAVTALPAARINEILGEQGLEPGECTSDDCALEIGRLLGVGHVVTGSVARQEQTYQLGCRMLNVEEGIVEKAVTRSYSGDVDGLILTVQRIVWDIVGVEPPPGRFPEDLMGPSSRPSKLIQRKYEIILVFVFLVLMGLISRTGGGGGVEDIISPPDWPSQ